MSAQEVIGCPEYRQLSRRRFLAHAATTAAAAGSLACFPRVSLARSYRAAQRDVLISIFLRGAADGLTLCTPFSEQAFYAARPNLAVPRPDSSAAESGKLRDLQASVVGPNGSVGFGIPPAMLPLLPAYQAGNLLFVHASGLTGSTRSHFDAQRYMEYGRVGDVGMTSGWVARHLQATPPADAGSTVRAVSLTNGLPFSLMEAPDAIATATLSGVSIEGLPDNEARRISTLKTLYDRTTDPLRSIALTTHDTIDLLSGISFTTYTPAAGAVYPSTPLGHSLKSTAALIKAQVGVEAIAIDFGEWDFHASQGNLTGNMANMMSALASALAAFHADMSAGTTATYTLVCMSEFGRRLRENASLGTDHGQGNVMMLMGTAIRGGRVLTQWPGLQTEQLYEGIDLRVTIDYRDVLAELAANRLGNPSASSLFPGYTPTFRGVTT